MKKSAAVLTLSAVLLSSLAWAASLTAELTLKEREHQDLAGAFRKFWEAKSKAKDTLKAMDKARTEVNEALTKVGKNAKKGADPIQTVLALHDDLARALYLSEERKTSAKGGEIGLVKFEADFGLDKPVKLSFAVWLPKAYKPSAGPFPAIVFVPGTREGKVIDPKQFLVENWADQPIREALVLIAVAMPDDTKVWEKVKNDDGTLGGIGVVMTVLGEALRTMAIDSDRLFLGGKEIGVQTALTIGSMYPHLFAGVFGQSGDCTAIGAQNFLNLPTYFAGGGSGATQFEEQSKGLGHSHCTPQKDGQDADVFAWLSSLRRDPNPKKVMLVPGQPAPFRSYWLEMERMELPEGTQIAAEVDRAANTITVQATHARSVRIYFNDALLDLDKPVKLVINGVERTEKIQRNLEETLQFFSGRKSDPGRIYVAAKAFDVPALVPPK